MLRVLGISSSHFANRPEADAALACAGLCAGCCVGCGWSLPGRWNPSLDLLNLHVLAFELSLPVPGNRSVGAEACFPLRDPKVQG